MKKVISILLVLVFAFTLFSCGGKKDEIRIGIAAPDVTHGWVAGVAYYAEKYCKENNIKYKIITSSDAAEMASSINDLIAWNADAIVTYPQWTGMESTIKEVVESGIPVVSFDVDIAVDGIYKIAGDNYGMGYASAEYIVKRVGSGANIAVFDVPSSGSVGVLRKQGFYDYLNSINYDTSKIFEVQCESFTREIGLRQMSDALNAHPTIDAVFVYDDEISIGCIQAITEAKRTDVKAITGGGGMQEYFRMINDAKYESMGLASALYSPMMIQDTISTAIKVCNGETVEKSLVIPTSIVTKENVSEYLDPENTIY